MKYSEKICRLKIDALLVLVSVIVLVLGTASGSWATANPDTPSSEGFVRTELFLGKAMSDGQTVPSQAFSAFVDRVVTRLFPEGLTIYETYGQMQHTSGKIEKQATWVILLVYTNTPKNSDAVREIISAYRKEFKNPQIMYLRSPVEALFYGN